MSNDANFAPLIRQRVIEERRQRLLGEVILGDSRATSTSVWAVAGACGLLFLWAATASYPRTAQVSGVVTTSTPGSKLYAKRPGTIARLMVSEGQLVHAGQAVALIDGDQRDGRAHALGAETLASLERQRTSVERQMSAVEVSTEADKARLTAQIVGLSREKSALNRQVSFQRSVVRSMTESFDRLGPLAAKGYISKLEMDRREQLLYSERQREQQLLMQQAQLDSREADLKGQQVQLIANRTDRNNEYRGRLETNTQQQWRVRSETAYTLVAPISGRVTAMQASVGRFADERLPVMIIVPDSSQFVADVFVPTSAIGFLKPGQSTRILYDAYPYKQFGSFSGNITTISNSILAPTEVDAAARISEPVYRVRVTLRDRSPALRPGMSLSAIVILERRTFFGWLLQPLKAMANRQ